MIALSSRLLLCLLLALGASAVSAEPLRVGVVPQYEERKLQAAWQPILQHLQEQTGETFALRPAKNIPEFERELNAGHYDLAYMNPFHLVMANKQQGYLPLVRDTERQLFGVLVVAANGEIDSPAQLDGKPVAFPAPNALGASLQMRQELLDLFGAQVIPQYVKTHDAVYLNVKLGVTAAGGGIARTLDQQRPLVRDALRVIHSTRKVASHPIAALPSLSETRREAITQALLQLAESESGRQMLQLIPMAKIGPASLADYAPLQQMGLERFYVPPQDLPKP
ncbi:MAG: phosphate/phosphite/phosphonate ABC transporter substrate-binding protein [Gammaproteobacteria bacterium]|nr:phosphate/phosphite/phosphonate ABC transporter substrate-binding protein [Gammaproteobacteria bacterium]